MGEFWRFSHTLCSSVESSLAFASASPNPWECFRGFREHCLGYSKVVLLFAGYSFVLHDGATVFVTPSRPLLMKVTMLAPSHGPHFYQLVDQFAGSLALGALWRNVQNLGIGVQPRD